MKFSRILAAGAIATAFAFADPMDDQDEAVEQNTEFEQSAEPADEQSTEQAAEAAEEQTAEASTEPATETKQAAAPEAAPASEPAYAPASEDNASYADMQPQKKTLNEKPGFGIHGSYEYSYLHGLPQDWNMGDDEDAPAGSGFVGGIRGRIPMNSFVQFTPEVNFHYATLNQEDEVGKRKFTQMDLEVPLLIRGIIMDYFYLTAGAQVGLDLSSKTTLNAGEVDMGGGLGTMVVSFNEKIDKASVSLGIVFGVGFYIMQYISIDAKLIMGLTDVYDVDPEENDLIDSMEGGKQMSFRVGIGFWVL